MEASSPPPNMASIAALEHSFRQNCSLNRSNGGGDGEEDLTNTNTNTNTTLELNSHLTLPYQWEQCLDLKTGEIYYINWEDGTKKKEDPRNIDCYNYSEDEEEDNEYESDGSSSSVSFSSPLLVTQDYNVSDNSSTNNNQEREEGELPGGGGDYILVVAGCKRCMMYFMLPKREQECPKCNGFLLHFDDNINGSL